MSTGGWFAWRWWRVCMWHWGGGGAGHAWCMWRLRVCVIPQAAWRGWQMLGAFLEAVTQEQGLPVCPLMGHMAGHCRHCVHLLPSCHTSCSNMLTSQLLQQQFITFPNACVWNDCLSNKRTHITLGYYNVDHVLLLYNVRLLHLFHCNCSVLSYNHKLRSLKLISCISQ